MGAVAQLQHVPQDTGYVDDLTLGAAKPCKRTCGRAAHGSEFRGPGSERLLLLNSLQACKGKSSDNR